MLRIIKLIFIKEIKEALRDKRSVLTIMVLSAFMPLFMMGGLFFSTSMAKKDMGTLYSVVGGEHAPSLVNYLNQNGLKTTDEVTEDSIQIIIPEDFQKKIATGYLPTIIVKIAVTKQPRLASLVDEAIKGYGREIAMSRLASRGVSPIILQPFKVDVQDTSKKSILSMIANFFVFMFMMIPIYSLMPAGIDTTAGERERHGLFPMLLQPIPTIAIPIGKFLMLVTSGMIALSIALAVGFTAFSYIKIDGLNFGFDTSIITYLLFLLVLLPTTMLLSGIIMGFASFAKSFKEGQTYVGISSILPMVFLGGGFALDAMWRPYLPFWAENTVLAAVLSGGNVSWLPWLGTVVGYLVIISLLMWWMSRSMRRQALQG
jgi:sodium transport system permease protein